MEKIIYFCRIAKGNNKEGKPYYFIEYIKEDFSVKRDYLEAIDYVNLEKKTKGKELQKVTAILGVNSFDRLYVKDIK